MHDVHTVCVTGNLQYSMCVRTHTYVLLHVLSLSLHAEPPYLSAVLGMYLPSVLALPVVLSTFCGLWPVLVVKLVWPEVVAVYQSLG